MPGSPLAPARAAWLWLGAGLLLGWGTSSWVRWARQQVLQLLWPLGPLVLQRPLVTFDIEATGLNVSRDRILEIAAVKLLPNGKVEVKGPQRLNPRVTISAEVTAIHHIRQEDVAGCPSFAEVAPEWRSFLEGCDLLGYNAKKFDVPLLRNEFRRCGQFNFPPLGVPVVDAFRLFCNHEPRTLSAAVKYYTGRDLSKDAAHSALGDSWATLRVLVEQVRRYPQLPRTTSGLAALCAQPGRAQDITPDGKFQWRGDQAVMGYGKHQGEPLAVLIARHKDHLMWMSGQDWGDESLIVVAQALKGLLPTKQGGWEPLFDTPPPEPDAAAANGRGHMRGSRRRQQELEEEEQQQQQQQAQAQLEEQQQAAAATQQEQPANSWGPAPTVAGLSAAAVAAAAGADAAAAGTAAAGWGTGWPPVGGEAEGAAAANPDSWGAEPAATAGQGGWEASADADTDAHGDAAAACAAGEDTAADDHTAAELEAGAEAATDAADGSDDGAAAVEPGVDDGWRRLQPPVAYPANPEPQSPQPSEEEAGEGEAATAATAAAAAEEAPQP